jgi:Holliday junction resolvase RusA-like endonuclease
VITLDVLGIPAPKGSGRAMLIAGRARFIASSSGANATNQTAWCRAIERSAGGCVLIDGPVRVSIAFRVRRPIGHYTNRGELREKAPPYPAVSPDLDKLVRCTLDALTGLAFDDDARVVALTVTKQYATPGREGASITVEAADA